MAQPVTLDILVCLARVNRGRIDTATDTATVIAELTGEADVVFAVWATNPADPDPTQFDAVPIKRSTPAWSEHRRQGDCN